MGGGSRVRSRRGGVRSGRGSEEGSRVRSGGGE